MSECKIVKLSGMVDKPEFVLEVKRNRILFVFLALRDELP